MATGRKVSGPALILLGSLVVVAIALATSGSRLSSVVWTNLAYLRLNADSQPDAASEATAAGQAFERALGDAPANDRALRGLGLALLNEGRQDAAIRIWSDHEQIGAELARWGQRAARSGDHQQALEWYELALAIMPDIADYRYRAGLAAMADGKLDVANSHLNAALDAGRLQTIGRSDILLQLGILAQREGTAGAADLVQRYSAAIEAVDFSNEQDEVQAHFRRAEALRVANELAEALEDYRWVAQRQPNNYWAHTHGGLLAWIVDRDLVSAEAYLLQAIETEPDQKWAYRNLGEVYVGAGRYEEAARQLERVLAIDSDDELAASLLRAAAHNAGD